MTLKIVGQDFSKKPKAPPPPPPMKTYNVTFATISQHATALVLARSVQMDDMYVYFYEETAEEVSKHMSRFGVTPSPTTVYRASIVLAVEQDKKSRSKILPFDVAIYSGTVNGTYQPEPIEIDVKTDRPK
jgi:hypothetical protein